MSGYPSYIDASSPFEADWQWHRCCTQCDGFNCQFTSQEPPLENSIYLGHGKEGYVTKVICRNQKVLARKVIRWYSRGEKLRQLQEEVRILRSLQHRHIVKIHGSYIQDRTFYGFLMEPAAECDLHDFLSRLSNDIQEPRKIDDLEISKQKEILWQGFGCLSSALSFIHKRRIKHRDIKPQNILVHRGSLYFTDFGIAKDFSDRSLSGSTGPTACTRRVSR
jgi:serine/threonine protein kinase